MQLCLLVVTGLVHLLLPTATRSVLDRWELA